MDNPFDEITQELPQPETHNRAMEVDREFLAEFQRKAEEERLFRIERYKDVELEITLDLSL